MNLTQGQKKEQLKIFEDQKNNRSEMTEIKTDLPRFTDLPTYFPTHLAILNSTVTLIKYLKVHVF